MLEDWNLSNAIDNAQKTTALIIGFRDMPTADKAMDLIEKLDFNSGLDTNLPVLSLIYNLQILAKAMNSGDVGFIKNIPKIKQDAEEVRLSEDHLKNLLTKVVNKNLAFSSKKMSAIDIKMGIFLDALTNLEKQFDITFE